jgi:XTP/dITP diphosphohydrolase
MEASASMTANFFRCHSGTSALLALPAGYIAGKMMLVRAMTKGWSLTSIMPNAQPLSMVNQPFDFAAFTPMQLATLNNEQLKMLSQFGSVIVGGAAVPDALRERLASYCDNVFETYGMAETLSHIAVRKLSSERIPFVALEGVQLSVDAEQRLQISAPHIHPEILQTQDVVQLLSPSEFYYKGRHDRVINSGGIKLFAEVIEKKLEPFLDRPYHVNSLPDNILGRRLVLYIESESPIDEMKLMERMSTALERYEVPKQIIVVRTLERTSSGKIKQIKEKNMELVFASANENKVLEVEHKLGGDIRLKSLRAIGCNEDIPETGDTLEENARMKARYVWDNYKVDCFADDTGLEVDALDGAPGVYSARYAGPQRNSEHNMDLLLTNLHGKSNRTAQFRTVICLICGGEEFLFEGVVRGEIMEQRRGTDGFGYDPVFRPEGANETFAEMTMDMKNTISHRGRAIALLSHFLKNK